MADRHGVAYDTATGRYLFEFRFGDPTRPALPEGASEVELGDMEDPTEGEPRDWVVEVRDGMGYKVASEAALVSMAVSARVAKQRELLALQAAKVEAQAEAADVRLSASARAKAAAEVAEIDRRMGG